MKQQSPRGWITRVYKGILRIFFGSLFGKHVSDRYGVSFNPDITLSDLPSLMPSVHEFYELADDVSFFEVVDVSIQNRIVTIREIGTDTEYPIDSNLFEVLFVRIDKPAISKY